MLGSAGGNFKKFHKEKFHKAVPVLNRAKPSA
jgi:hypothetical protein